MPRRTYPHNPRGFHKNTWNYRCLQLRHALGWGQAKLATVMGVSIRVVRNLEAGIVTRPLIPTIRAIKKVENMYSDIIEEYKKSPVKMDRLRHYKGRDYGKGIYLLPIEVRRPEDIKALEKMGASGEDQFFGRRTRAKMQQTGMSMQRKAFLDRRRKAISRAMRKKVATGWRARPRNSKAQSGRSEDDRDGQGGLDPGVYTETAGPTTKTKGD